MKNCNTCVYNPWLPDGRIGQITKTCIECRYVAPEEPSNWTPRPKTNWDRIREMSLEELGRFLASVENRRSAAGGGAIWKGAAHAIQWLRETAEETE